MLLGVNGNFGDYRYRRGGRDRWNKSVCDACLIENSCSQCKKAKNCEPNECKDSGGSKFRGLSGIIPDSMDDAVGTITACGFFPILVGFAAGYFAKQMKWI